ncbi:MAG: MFS transporter [Phycisphaerales bacterium]|nr:MFS transporter [Phycisphaerales bacterium]
MSTTNRGRLFVASCVALIVTAMSFAIRGDIMGALEVQFSLTKEQLGTIASTAFWGFTLAMIVGGPLCDVLGMKRLVWFAFAGHLAGIVTTIFANGFWTLFGGTLAIGIANGFVEAACNPLIATVYPEEKTKKLNHFHVWFPGGIVIGGLGCFALSQLDMNWQWKMGLMPVPLVGYAAMFLGQQFPVTERVASGVSMGRMFRECLRPLFIVMILSMLLTASTELGPGQWIPNILTFTAGVSGILVLCWINGLMAVGRGLAGPIVHKLSPSGVLLASAVLAGVGLFLLSQADSQVTAFGAATVFALGVCYFWPTMLGFVAERLPKTGALGLSAMGGAGMLAVSLILPVMGAMYDRNTASAIPATYTVEQLRQSTAGTAQGKVWAEAQAEGGAETLKYVAGLPVVLVVVFGAIYLRDRASGGYRAERLGAAEG